jgi:hypothetical protein
MPTTWKIAYDAYVDLEGNRLLADKLGNTIVRVLYRPHWLSVGYFDISSSTVWGSTDTIHFNLLCTQYTYELVESCTPFILSVLSKLTRITHTIPHTPIMNRLIKEVWGSKPK